MKKIINNKWLKTIVILFILCLFFTNSYVMADSDILGNLDNYAQKQDTPIKFTNKVSEILSIFQIVGSLISIICLIVLGVKYMTGSVEEKANYKKTLIPYVLGAVMVLGISNFINIIYKVAIGMF